MRKLVLDALRLRCAHASTTVVRPQVRRSRPTPWQARKSVASGGSLELLQSDNESLVKCTVTSTVRLQVS